MALAIGPTTRMQEISHYFARHVHSLGLTYPCQEMNHLMSESCFDTEVTSAMIRTPSWKYTRSFVMDGNFKAEHLHPIKPFDEVWLSDGLGFMVGKDRYKKHLAEAADTGKIELQQSPGGKSSKCGSAQAGVHGYRGSCLCPTRLLCPSLDGRFSERRKASQACHSMFTS